MTEKKTGPMEAKVRGCLLGIAVGDALGMPWETMTHQEILAANDGRHVTEMSDPVQRRLTDTVNFRRGMTTDDTQLTASVAESLIRCGGFDLEDQAREHLVAYENSVAGWGGTTRLAMESLRAGRHPSIPMPPIQVAPGKNPKGRGNGVAMKIAPLALWHALRQTWFEPEPLLTDAMELGRMTHSDIRASIAAYAVAIVIAHNFVIKYDGRNPQGYLEWLIREVKMAEQRWRFVQDDEDCVSKRLSAMGSVFPDLDALTEIVRPGCDALESVPFAIGVALRHPRHIDLALVEAVNAGGDTDTNAAMVGAMCGANLDSISSSPSMYGLIRDLVDQGREMTDLAARLTLAALR
jgi:ADP-ribosylglycohydrolase